ncbi:MAG TPA: ABC transporter permease [Candidatus Eisenbacteria bacterium]|nr:ABC transporter permease [Candidatus Eisenbacteria bacterium]
MRHTNVLRDFLQDLAYTARILKNAPTYSVIVILTIALGTGATTAIFSVVNAVLLRPLPHKDSNRLVLSDYPISNADFFDLRDGSKSAFDDLAALMVFRAIAPHEDGSAERIGKGQVTTNFFRMLGAHVVVGRDFNEPDGVSNGPPPPPFPPAEGSVAIVSYDYFQRRYGADRNIIGRRLLANTGSGPEIVGVLSPDFKVVLPTDVTSERSVDVWIPNDRGYDEEHRGDLMLYVVGRLKPEITVTQAQSQVDRITEMWGHDGPKVRFFSWRKLLVNEVRPTLLTLMAAVVLLFLVACANTGNLMLVRTFSREREFAIRTALGARRGRLTRQMLTEALLLCSLGTFLGIVLASVGIHTLIEAAPSNLPRMDSTSVDWRVILFSGFCGIFGSALVGMLPSSYFARSRLMQTLRSSGRSRQLSATGFVRSGVVIAEIAVAFVLLLGSGLMFRSFVQLLHVSPGYDPQGLLTFLTIGNAKDVPDEQRISFLRNLEDRLRSIPGVQSVGGATGLPLHVVGPPDGIQWSAEQIPADPNRRVDLETVLPGYFEALHSRVLEGRTFSEADNANGQGLAVIDQSLARNAFPNQSAVDRRICVYIPDPTWLRIIGVVEHQRLHTLAHTGPEQIFVTDGFSGIGISRQWALRTAGDPEKYASLVRSEIAKFAPGRLAITEMQTMNATTKSEQTGTRFSAVLIGLFAVVAAFLSVVGLYGVVSSTVRQRTAEIGLRIAFGAEPSSVVRLMIGQGLILGTIGIGIGLLASFWLTSFMSSMLVGIHPTDSTTYTLVSASFLLVSVIACWVPARRAGVINPLAALHED